MALITPDRQFDPDRPEMIDRNDNPPDILQQDLANLRTINRYFGGLSAVTSQLEYLFSKTDRSEVIEILDLATGSADLPKAVLRWAQKNGWRIRITAVDKNPAILDIAHNYLGSNSDISLKQQDILDMEFAPDSFDIVLCSLALHHFSEKQATELLYHMNRISRVGFLVNDLHRSWLAVVVTWLYTTISTRNPMTRHDSYLSVLRGFTKSEMQAMAGKAGIKTCRIIKRPMFRLILTGEKDAY
jgi:ubiquinone/menaquinone biosynthesis C-methylase UbiE